MKYRVRYTPQANREVAGIVKALAPYPGMAKRILQELDRKIEWLKGNPLAWPAYHANPKYRRMNIEGHSIFYIVDDDKHEVIICHICYAKRDITRLLKD